MSSPNDLIEESLMQLLTCPVCLDHCQAPVFTCVNGHVICSDCKVQVKQCPMCRAVGSPATRNLALDALSDQVLTVPCQFQSKGCGVKRKREEDLEGHYQNCMFRPVYKCLVHSTCEFVGCRNEVHDHVQNEHPEKLLLMRKATSVTFNTSDDQLYGVILKWTNAMQNGNTEDEYFWICSSHIPTGKAVFYARYIGPSNSAKMFKIGWTIVTAYKTSVLKSVKEMKCWKTPLTFDVDALASTDVIELEDSYFDLTPGVQRKVDISVTAVIKLHRTIPAR